MMETIESITSKIKDKMGDTFPKDLIIEFNYPELRFYKKETPYKDTIGVFENINDNDIDSIKRIIEEYYI